MGRITHFFATNNAAAVGGACVGLIASLVAAATVPDAAGAYVAACGAVALASGAVVTVMVHRRDLPSDRALNQLAKVMTVAGALMAMFAALQLLGLESEKVLPWAAAPVGFLLLGSVAISVSTKGQDKAAVDAVASELNAAGDSPADQALSQAEKAVETAGNAKDEAVTAVEIASEAKDDAKEALDIARKLEADAQREVLLTEALGATLSALTRRCRRRGLHARRR